MWWVKVNRATCFIFAEMLWTLAEYEGREPEKSKSLTILPYLYTAKDMVEPYYIKGVQKQPFAHVLQNRYSWNFY